MSEFKIGDRVLVDGVLERTIVDIDADSRCSIQLNEAVPSRHILNTTTIWPLTSRLSLATPPKAHSDATRFVTGETHAWRGVEITSGAGQVELLLVHGDKSLGVVLTPAQAYDLGHELMKRSCELRSAK